MRIEVTRYRKTDGYLTRYWSVTVDGELLVVTLYRKGAEAVAKALTTLIMESQPDMSGLQIGPEHAMRTDPAEDAPSTREPAPCGTDSLPPGIMLPLPETEAARRKRRRKGLVRKILGDCPF